MSWRSEWQEDDHVHVYPESGDEPDIMHATRGYRTTAPLGGKCALCKAGLCVQRVAHGTLGKLIVHARELDA